MKVNSNIDLANNRWEQGINASKIYETAYNYDANGNITGLLRNGNLNDQNQTKMDSLTYLYQKISFGQIITSN